MRARMVGYGHSAAVPHEGDCALALSKRDGTSRSPSRLRSLSALFVPPLPLRHGRGHPVGEPCAHCRPHGRFPAHKRLAHNNGMVAPSLTGIKSAKVERVTYH